MRKAIMATLAGRLVNHALRVIMVITMTGVLAEATRMPPLMPISPPPLPEYRQLITSQFHEDYGIWNPTPSFGGGDMAPIPHGVVEE